MRCFDHAGQISSDLRGRVVNREFIDGRDSNATDATGLRFDDPNQHPLSSSRLVRRQELRVQNQVRRGKLAKLKCVALVASQALTHDQLLQCQFELHTLDDRDGWTLAHMNFQ